jgi:hypothetical protein
MRICDLLLGQPPSQARLADRLDEAAGELRAELVAHWEADVELEAMQTLVLRVRDLVLNNTDAPSFLAASLSMVVELIEGRINTVASSGVRQGTQSVLVAALSHFPELNSELELLGSRCNADLREDQADSLRT